MVNRELTGPFGSQPIFRNMPMKLQSSTTSVHDERLNSARRTLETEASGMTELIAALSGRLGEAIADAVELIALPLSRPATKMSDALVVMTEKACGCLGIIDDQGKLIGILTDGDLRRHMSSDLLSMRVQDVMTRAPKTIEPDALTSEALEILNGASITCIFVIDEAAKPWASSTSTISCALA